MTASLLFGFVNVMNSYKLQVKIYVSNLCRKPSFNVYFRGASGGRQPPPPPEGGLGTRIPPKIKPGPRGGQKYRFMVSWTGQPRGSLDVMFTIRGQTSLISGSKRSFQFKNQQEKVGAQPPHLLPQAFKRERPVATPNFDDFQPRI